MHKILKTDSSDCLMENLEGISLLGALYFLSVQKEHRKFSRFQFEEKGVLKGIENLVKRNYVKEIREGGIVLFYEFTETGIDYRDKILKYMLTD